MGHNRLVDSSPLVADLPLPARYFWAILREAFKSAFSSNPQDLHLNSDCEGRFDLWTYPHLNKFGKCAGQCFNLASFSSALYSKKERNLRNSKSEVPLLFLPCAANVCQILAATRFQVRGINYPPAENAVAISTETVDLPCQSSKMSLAEFSPEDYAST